MTAPAPTRVLFVCIGNSCRSPMAEALARHLASDVIEAASAGVSPLGRVQDATRAVLLERGVAVEGLWSKGLGAAPALGADLVVNMTGMPGGALFPGGRVEDWAVEDPYGEDMITYREIRDDIEERIQRLAARLRAEHAARERGATGR